MDKNINKPKITVLMSVYNSEKYLKEAIESILSQSFTDFEFLIIDDGSTDNSREIIESYKDTHIKLITNEQNIGLAKSLNKGMNKARGEYIARMDADDISLPKRLEIQFNFMEESPNIGAVGTWAKVIGKGEKKYIKTYSDFEKIKVESLFSNIIVHPSVMIRREFFDKYNLRYDESLSCSQDYELWTKAIKFFPISNIKKFLITYRIHKKSTSKEKQKEQIENSKKTRIKQLKNINITPTEEEEIIHCNTYKPQQFDLNYFLKKQEMWLKKLIEANKETGYCKEPQFSEVVANRWLAICSVNSNYDFKIFKIFRKSTLRKKLNWKNFENIKFLIKFFLKCIIKKTKNN